jgi:hypothetical protein
MAVRSRGRQLAARGRSTAVHRAEVGSGGDLTDLVADVLSQQRCLRVVEDDAVLVVDETLADVNVGQNRFQAERPDMIDERLALRVEDLALPGEEIDELRDFGRPRRAGIDDGGALRLTVGNGAGGLPAKSFSISAWGIFRRLETS